MAIAPAGWLIRGAKRRRAADRGFVLSDHADWDGLVSAIDATGCECVYLTHGYTATFTRYLNEIGYNAREVHTLYGDDEGEALAGPLLDETLPAGASPQSSPVEKGFKEKGITQQNQKVSRKGGDSEEEEEPT